MNPANVISYPLKASTTLSAHLRVKITTDGVEAAGASDQEVGTILNDADASVVGRDHASIALAKNYGVHYLTYGTSTALAAGDTLVRAANGKVTKGASSPIGVALQSAAADGDIIRAILY